MASETERAMKPYLHRVLADGIQPFHYRGRVRALLGHPDAGGVEMNFAKPLPVGGFAYLRPPITGELDVGDEMPADKPRRVAGFEDRRPPIADEPTGVGSHRVVGAPEPGNLGRGHDGVQRGIPGRNGPDLATAGSVVRNGGERSQEAAKVMPDSPAARGAAARIAESGTSTLEPAGGRPATVQAQSGNGRLGPTSRARDIIVPDACERRHQIAASSEPADAQESVRPAARIGETHPQATSGAPPADFAASPSVPDIGAIARPHRAAGDAPPHATIADSQRGLTVERSQPVPDELRSKPWQASHALAVSNESAPPRKRLEAKAWPMRSGTPPAIPDGLGNDGVALARGVASATRSDQPFHYTRVRARSDARRQAPADAASSPEPAAPVPQPPTIVVNPPPAASTPPLAFWERRHLTHWRVRMRR
jgi:hypothetical protein